MCMPNPLFTLPYNWFSDGVYAGKSVYQGLSICRIIYQIENWFSVGLSVSYVGFYQK